MSNELVANRYELIRKVGKGSFGEVYIGFDNKKKEEVAMKLEIRHNHGQRLSLEKNLYGKLHGGLGVPHVMWYGIYEEYNILIMDLLGPSLDDLFRYCSKRFSLKTVLMLADQMMKRLEYIHKQGVVHRDIKPDNFLMGLGRNSHLVHLVDFGLAMEFCVTSSSRPPKRSPGMTGTARYASLNAHQGVEQSPRDDLESLCYSLIYFLRGNLPWQFLSGENKKQRIERIAEVKLTTSIEEICDGIPEEFKDFLKYCRSVGFMEEPNYFKIRHSFWYLFEHHNFVFDYKYDWTQL